MEAYRKEAEIPSQECVYTSSNGAQQPHPYYAQRAGSGGGLLLQDYHLIGTLALCPPSTFRHFATQRLQ